jgi:hypothetical protein
MSLINVQNKLNATQTKSKDRYVVFYKDVTGKIKANSRQYITLRQINCTVCYDIDLVDKTKDTILNLHPALGKGFIVSKMCVVFDRRKVDLTSIENCFFEGINSCLKQYHLSLNNYFSELGKSLSKSLKQSILTRGMFHSETSSTLFFEVAYEVACEFFLKSDRQSKYYD